MAWIALLIAAGVAGLGLTLLGLHGRRIDDHPLCRRCGFDLFGNPGATTCTECGADLTRPRAVTVGHRVRRRGPLWAGAALLVPAVLLLAGSVYVAFDADAWQRNEPEWWLVSDLDSPQSAPAAVGELLRRTQAGGIGDDAWHALVDRALDAQADLVQAWQIVPWPSLLTDAMAKGKFTAAQRRRYTRTALGLNPTSPEAAAAEAWVWSQRVAAGDDELRVSRLDGLDEAAQAELVEEILERQADLDQGWVRSPWPVLLRDALDKGLLTQAQREQSLLNAFALELDARPVIRQGDPLPAYLRFGSSRPADGDSWLLVAEWLEATALGRPLPLGRSKFTRMEITDTGGSTWLPRRFEVDTADWPVGEASLEARFHVRIGRPPAEGVWLRDEELPEKLEHEARLTLRTPFAVLPKDATQPWFAEDPEADRAAIEAAISVSPVYVEPGRTNFGLTVKINERAGVAAIPVRLNGEIILRAGGRESSRENGQIQFQPSASPTEISHGFNVEHWPTASGKFESTLERVDVILRPDVDSIKWSADPARVWDGEVVIRDVPVYHDRPPESDLWGRNAEWYGVGGRREAE